MDPSSGIMITKFVSWEKFDVFPDRKDPHCPLNPAETRFGEEQTANHSSHFEQYLHFGHTTDV